MRPIEPLTKDNAGEEVAALLEEWGQNMLVVGTNEESDAQFVGLLAHRPEPMKSVLDHYATFYMQGTLPTRLKELLRLATADAIGCNEYCVNIRLAPGRQAGVTEDDVVKLRNLEQSDLPGEEKAALRFAGAFVRNPRNLESHFEELKRHFTDAQIVEIGVACATYMGFGNMVVAFGLQAGLDSPLARRSEGAAA